MLEILKFVPFESHVDPIFWQIFSSKKLEELKLDDSPIKINGYYENSELQSQRALFNIDYNSFDSKNRRLTDLPLYGVLKNTNTIEDFLELDKNELKSSLGGKEIWDGIVSGKALEDPLVLSKFFCFSFADLKKYNFHFIFCFPAVKYPETFLLEPARELSAIFTETQTQQLLDQYSEITDIATRAYFLIHVSEEAAISIHHLKEFDQLTTGKVLLGFADPSKSKTNPSWVLRNLLALAAYHWSGRTEWAVVCLRQRFQLGQWLDNHSLVLDLKLESVDPPQAMPPVVGYELNKDQKPLPQLHKLGQTLDPLSLAKTAVNMNLKLMKWASAPDLPLDKIMSSKCLLMGAGTLGCGVARSLLAWGVKTITLVDNGLVKYSNPVRQILYNFQHCTSSSKPNKATIAAEELHRIYPHVEATGHNLSIPMPGHHVSDAVVEQVKQDVALLEELVQSHDIIFLLLDTREARWLPTLLGAFYKKVVINAALGFDSYLIQRHGSKLEPTEPLPQFQPDGPIPGHKLSCYFCSDVVQPGNSTRNRTLDQQCTVTRPGVSMIASAYAVEMMVDILTHPLGALAYGGKECDEESVGRVIPHHIRGALDNYSQFYMAMEAFDMCPACSPQVLAKYQEEKFQFLMNCFNIPNYLDDITGLSEMHRKSNECEIWAASDLESDLESS